MTRHDQHGQYQSSDPEQGYEADVEDVDEIGLDDLEHIDDGWTLGPQLAQLFAPSAELDRDVSDQVDRRLRARSPIGDVMDLIGLGWSTMRMLLIDDTSGADREEEGL